MRMRTSASQQSPYLLIPTSFFNNTSLSVTQVILRTPLQNIGNSNRQLRTTLYITFDRCRVYWMTAYLRLYLSVYRLFDQRRNMANICYLATITCNTDTSSKYSKSLQITKLCYIVTVLLILSPDECHSTSHQSSIREHNLELTSV